jgi:lysophospholipase L1-like esterase
MRLRRRDGLLALLAVACTGPGRAAESPKVDNEMARYWRRRVAEFEAAQAAGSVPRGGIVFLGDSMTERFDLARHFAADVRRPLVNRGIGGDKIGGWRYWGLLDRLDSTVLALAPHQVVLAIGVNDLVFAHTPLDNLLPNAERLLARLSAAVPNVLVQAVLPVRASLARHNGAIRSFNRELAAMTTKLGLPLLDAAPALADAEGELSADCAADAVHLNAEGYRRWAERIRPRLRG